MQKRFKKVICSNHRWVVGLSVAAALMFGASAAPNPVKTKKSPSAPSAKATPVAKLRSSLLEMPLAFELNRGQTDAKVKFLTRAQNFTVFLMPGETVLRGRNDDVLRLTLQNANKSPKVEGENRQRKITNYYVGGDRSKWLEGVPNFGQVRYRDVYSGIDMVYHSDQRQLEYDFVVKPGADPNLIRVAFDGPSKIGITEEGDLKLESVAGTSVHHKPVVYQTIDGKRKLVAGEFALAGNMVGFKVGEYDHTQPLVIDPTLQVLSFFGGTLNDEAAGVATSASQNSLTAAGVVFVGRSESPSLPSNSTGNTVNKTTGGISWDAFATGLNAAAAGVPDSGGTTILWTTYFGGSLDDAARAVAMDNQGNVYVAGYTDSLNFLGTLTAVSYDAFIVKLNAIGGSITASTLYGGPQADQATSIALDYSTFSTLANASSIVNPATDPTVVPNVVIGGVTNGGIGQPGSPATTIGKTPDGYQKNFNTCTQGGGSAPGCGNTDGFVATFTSGLTLLHATYIGGGGNDQVNGVAADVWGNIYATGFATPDVTPNFPTKNGIATTTQRGGCNTGSGTGCWDASLAQQNTATPFVVKWDCRTGTPPIGVPSPPFGYTGSPAVNSQFPICGGTNNLATLANSALFGGSAAGNTFINPQQTAQAPALGQTICSAAGASTPCVEGITEAGLAIAVDQNGWGQEGVAGIPPNGISIQNGAGFPDIVPFTDFSAVSATGTNGGFQPGLSGPHVYVVGTTASSDFALSLTGGRASCTAFPIVVGPIGVPPLCPAPEVWGSVVIPPGTLPVPACDAGVGNCPTGATTVANLRIKTVTVGATTVNTGQTQGWLVALQFPAVTQEVVEVPPNTSASAVTSLNPPTIPNYIALQPATCPPPVPGAPYQAPLCQTGGINTAAGTFTAAAPANFGCGFPGVISCPTAFMGSWNAVAVDSDQQVYVVGQIGMNGAADAFPAAAGVPPNRLALEIERIAPYANTPSFFGSPCNAPNAPCAFPETLWPDPITAATSAFVVDVGVGAGGPGILNSNFGQILPGAPPASDPNQPGGLGNGVAVSPFREAFFVGTSTAVNPANTLTQATQAITIVGGAVVLGATTAGAGYNAPTPNSINIPVTGVTGCTTNPIVTATVVGGGLTFALTNAGAGCTAVAPALTIPAPTGLTITSTNSLATTAIEASVAPTPKFQGNLGSTGGSNPSSGAASPGNAALPSESVLFGALQFYDAIAFPSTAINFTANVNDVTSITAPNGITGGPTGLNAKATINYFNWEGQPVNIPPGCLVLPLVPTVPELGAPAFTVTPGIGNSFVVQVNPAAVAFPGVITSVVTFAKSNGCTGAGQPPIDSWDPITLTLSVSAPLNASVEYPTTVNYEGWSITEALASGILQPFYGYGLQVANNQPVNTFLDVSTAASSGPMNFTVQLVAGPNWPSGLVTVNGGAPADTIYATVAGVNTTTQIPVTFNALAIIGLPVGTYTADLVIAASPETPAEPASGSTVCMATLPVGSGTTSAICIPISITVTAAPLAAPAAIVFGTNTTTPQQTGLSISNPLTTTATYNFTTGYQPAPIFGTALPATNVFFVGTGTTLIPATVGNTISGSIAPGGVFTVPIQVNPVGLPTGVYSGQLLVSGNGQASGATPQTTVPIIVYVGPHAGEDLPSGNGLGLMLPVNSPPIGTGQLPGAAPGSPGSYPLMLSVPSGYGPSQIANPTVVEVTALNNTSTVPISLNSPSVSGLAGVTLTNLGQSFGGTLSGCGSTYAELNVLPNSPLGPTCAWNIWVNATALNSSNTTTMAACGGGFGETGTLTFGNGGGNVANLVVPLTVCVTDSPVLTVGIPATYPNPTFGPGGPGNSLIPIPSNVPVGFTQIIVDSPLPAKGIALMQQAGNSNPQCQVLDVHTNGGFVPDVTIAPLTVPWLSIQTPPGTFTGLIPSPNGITGFSPINSVGAQFAAGPDTIGPGLVTFEICADTDPLGNVTGSYNTSFTVIGEGGPITVPVSFLIANTTGVSTTNGTATEFSQLGVFRPTAAAPNTSMAFYLDNSGANAWSAADKVRLFGVTGIPGTTVNDIPVAGDWDGTGVVRFGVFHCPVATLGPCTWFIDLNNNGQWDGAFGGDAAWVNFGLAGDIPVVGDWTGDGKSKIGVIRCTPGSPNPCVWYLDMGNKHTYDPATVGILFLGAAGDMPAVGSWQTSPTTTPAMQIGVVHCPTVGASCTWTVDSIGKTGSANPTPIDVRLTATTAGTFTAAGGYQAGDVAVMGNWNGNGKLRMGIFRSSTGQWYVDTNGNGVYDPGVDQVFAFGLPPAMNPGGVADQPIVGFWTMP